MPLLNYTSKRPSLPQKDLNNSQTECKADAVKAYMKNYCSHRVENGQNIYRAILTETFQDEANGIRKVEVGDKSSQRWIPHQFMHQHQILDGFERFFQTIRIAQFSSFFQKLTNSQ